MSNRELVVLGTSSQVPTRYRNHNGYLLRWDEQGFLFDPGEGTQRQMIFADVTATSITRMFITHFHGDHCLGLAGMSQRISLDRVPHEIPVHYPASGDVFFRRLRHASIYHDVSKIVPRPVKDEGIIFEDDRFTMRALHLEHGVETFGYRIKEADSYTMIPEKLREAGIKGKEIGDLQKNGTLVKDGKEFRAEDFSVPRKGQCVAFIMDTRFCENAIRLAQDADMVICDSTYLSSEKSDAKKNGHMTAGQAATVAKEANANLLVLSHFSQRYTSLKPFYEEASKIHPNVVVAKDCTRISFKSERSETA
ncbi:MAG: ribonuclease Z [Myxococcota bacterium]|nr:ribonuclease Z [Myxococcota bacterium]